METVLITGVSGFLGRYIARLFSEQGWIVIGISSSSFENAPTTSLKIYRSLKLPDPRLADIIKEYSPTLCIHCAGRASVGASVEEPDADFYTNTALTFEVLNTLRLHAPFCKFIFLSSAAVYGNPQHLPIGEDQPTAPLSPYGFHKLQCEQLCLEFSKVYELRTASVRIFSAYGPGLRRQVLWDICQKALTQPLICLQGTGRESRDFIHALDVAKALLFVADKALMNGEAYNLGSGEETRIDRLASLVINSLNLDSEPVFSGVVPVGVPLNWKANISKISNLGFNPSIPLEKGVKIFANWCQAELIGY